MVRFLNRRVILPLSDLIQDLRISESLDFLSESQFWQYDRLIDYQNNRLKKLLEFVYENVPFYKNWFNTQSIRPSDIRGISDLYLLPIITKSEIRNNPELFLPRQRQNKKSIKLCSSGSTGEPFSYFISGEAFSLKYAAALRGWSWMGYELGDSYAKLSQNKRNSLLKKVQDVVNRCLYIYIPDLSKQSLLNTIEILKKNQPEYLRCYPDPLYFAAKIMQERNQKLSGIKAINTTGNILTPEARNLIEESFGCPVFDSYSCEGSALFYEGPTRESYLGSMEYAVTEIIDNNNQQVVDKGKGFHITTDLHNYAMPLIRYNTQDLIEKTGNKSSCGRSLFSINKVIGRENDILVTPSGNHLIVHLFTIYFEYFPSVLQFQIEQTGTHEFIFRFVVDKSFNNEIISEIHKYWQDFLGINVHLSIEIHDSIPLLYSGKRRFLIRNPEIKLGI